MRERFKARLNDIAKDASIDAEGNVIALRKGSGGGPKLVVSAHLDTVFPEGTDVTVKEKDGVILAPGIGDLVIRHAGGDFGVLDGKKSAKAAAGFAFFHLYHFKAFNMLQ